MKVILVLLSMASWQLDALAIRPVVVRPVESAPMRCCCCPSAAACRCGCDKPATESSGETVRLIVCPCGATPATAQQGVRTITGTEPLPCTISPAVEVLTPPHLGACLLDGENVHGPPPDLAFISTVVMLD